MNEATQVVSAAIIKDGRLLLAQRGPGSHAWCWCTPGGKVNAGETHDQALQREMFEELGSNAGIGSYSLQVFVHEGEQTTAKRIYRLTCYAVNPLLGALFIPQPSEKIIGVGYFTAEDIENLVLAPADSANREALCALVRASR